MLLCDDAVLLSGSALQLCNLFLILRHIAEILAGRLQLHRVVTAAVVVLDIRNRLQSWRALPLRRTASSQSRPRSLPGAKKIFPSPTHSWQKWRQLMMTTEKLAAVKGAVMDGKLVQSAGGIIVKMGQSDKLGFDWKQGNRHC